MLLQTFDLLKLNNIHERRTACKPLYHYFQKLMLEIGVVFCNLDQNSLRTSHLKNRWRNIKYCLSCIEDPKRWDALINEMNNIRQKVEHNDYFDLRPERLTEIRKKAPEFKEWLICTSKEYYKKSAKFTFKEAFYHILNRYAREAGEIIQEYGEKTPYVACKPRDYSGYLEENSYLRLSELTKALQRKLENISKLEDIECSNLEKLIQIVEIISSFRGKEEILLRYYVCPKCGSKIEENQRYFGGGREDQPEPDGVYIRVGCEKCDYVVHSETIYI